MAQEPQAQRENEPERPDSPPKKAESQGFISRLAQRSTGLGPPVSAPQDDNEQSPWRIAGMGLQLVATTLVFAGMGYLLDREFGSSPWGVVVMSLIGLVGGLYLLIKEALKITK